MKQYSVKIETIYMDDFIAMLKNTNLWNEIKNIEIKNYKETKKLIYK